ARRARRAGRACRRRAPSPASPGPRRAPPRAPRPSARSSLVLADERAQLVLEPAGLDRAVDAALLRRALLPPPAPGAQVLARRRRPGAGRAADRGVALRVQRVHGQVVLAHVVPHLVLGPLGERV